MVNDFLVKVANISDDWLNGFVQRHRISQPQQLIVELQLLINKIKLIVNYDEIQRRIELRKKPEEEQKKKWEGIKKYKITGLEYEGKKSDLEIPKEFFKEKGKTQKYLAELTKKSNFSLPRIPEKILEKMLDLARRLADPDPETRAKAEYEWLELHPSEKDNKTYNGEIFSGVSREEATDILELIKSRRENLIKSEERINLFLNQIVKIENLEKNVIKVFNL